MRSDLPPARGGCRRMDGQTPWFVRPGRLACSSRRAAGVTGIPAAAPIPFCKIDRGEGSGRMPRIKAMLREGKVVRVFATGQLLSPKLIEIVGEHGDFDALWLDQEHAGLTMKEIELATMAARAYGMDHFVRLPATDYAAVMRPLEAGAGGVMISMVRSAAEVEQAVRWAKFAPRGRARGQRRQPRRPLRPGPPGRVHRAGQCRDVHRRPDRDGRRAGVGRRDRRGAGR